MLEDAKILMLASPHNEELVGRRKARSQRFKGLTQRLKVVPGITLNKIFILKGVSI